MFVALFVEFSQTSEPSSVNMLLMPTCKNMCKATSTALKISHSFFENHGAMLGVACGRRRLKRMSPLLLPRVSKRVTIASSELQLQHARSWQLQAH